jgi:O-antigen ligase
MAVVEFDPAGAQELRDHRRSFMTFERLVLFAIMHVALVLSCLALAFLGDVPWIGFLLGVGGTLSLIAAFVVTGTSSRT